MISVYARGRDYHDVVKARLKALARWIDGRWPGALKLFVDTAPVMEKPLAQAAGLGWQGKHTNLVSRRFGSWLFLGEIYLALELPPDAAETDHCGACRRCLDACPTAAFPAPYRLDARRCISYLTIEHKGHIAAELRPLMGNRIYGCDDCLAVCPWNKFARATAEPGFRPRAALDATALAELARLDDAGFRALFAGSPVKRIGRDRFLRNVLIAIGNSGAAALLPAVEERLDDPSPLVRAMAVWALRRLAQLPVVEAQRAARLAREADAAVRAEWQDGARGSNEGLPLGRNRPYLQQSESGGTMSDKIDWRNQGVRVVRGTELDPNTAQTPGMSRASAITYAQHGAQKLWAGTVTIHANAKTGAHHHGEVESVIYVVKGKARMRWGDHLEFMAEAGPGDFIYVPPYVPHQEINASSSEVLECVLCRSGQEPVVVNLDITPVEPPEEVRWIDPIHRS